MRGRVGPTSGRPPLEHVAHATSRTHLEQERTMLAGVEAQLQQEHTTREVSQVELQREHETCQAAEAAFETKEKAVILLTELLVGGKIAMRHLRTLADGLREQLEAEKRHVEGKWLTMIHMLPPLQRVLPPSCLCSALQQAVMAETAAKTSIKMAYSAGQQEFADLENVAIAVCREFEDHNQSSAGAEQPTDFASVACLLPRSPEDPRGGDDTLPAQP